MFFSTPGDGGFGRIDEVQPSEGLRRLVRFSSGLFLLAMAIGVLAWNERCVVRNLRDLSQVAKAVTEVTASGIDPSQDGRLVHLTGTLSVIQPLSDSAMGFSRSGLVRLKRTVEMYQWRESRQSSAGGQIGASDAVRATYSYAKKWSEAAIDSRRFKASARHENPSMLIRTELATAGDATIGDRVLAPSLLARLDAFEPVAPPSRAPAGFTRTADGFYKGANAEAPEIGDIRVTFAGVPVQPVSVVAEQRGARLVAASAPGGASVAQVAPGHVSASDLVAQRQDRSTRTWIVRSAGFGLLVLGLVLMRTSLPAKDGRNHALVVCLAGATTTATIGLAWLAFRPWLGALLIVGALLVVLLYGRLRHTRLPRPQAPVQVA